MMHAKETQTPQVCHYIHQYTKVLCIYFINAFPGETYKLLMPVHLKTEEMDND